MEPERFNNIVNQIRNGGMPPTVGYRISPKQYSEIINAGLEAINGRSESKLEVQVLSKYLQNWSLKITDGIHSQR